MRILQVNKFNYVRGGAEKYFIEIAKELERAGHQVAIFSMHHPKNIPSPWSEYFVSRISFNEGKWRDKLISPGRILYSLEAKRKFKKIILDFKPDIIHIHNIYHQISPSILRVAKKYNIPVIMHLHDYKLVCPNYQLFVKNKICFRCLTHKYYNCFRLKCFKNNFWSSFLAMIEMYFHHSILKIYQKNISFFISPSQFMKKTLIKFSWPEDKIKVLYNFSEKLENDSPDDWENYALYFGRLSPEKGISLILRAWSKIKSDTKLKIVGSGPEEDNLKKLVASLNLNDKVDFLGPLFDQDLHKVIKKAKFVLIPSLWAENMPLSLLESLMLKKVVVASNTGVYQKLLRIKRRGFYLKTAISKI
ncbi:MAG: glycosyltransferase [Patescibacteria group bacterium]|jgi:glycosyltransferase involved in cell wall biosynthesis